MWTDVIRFFPTGLHAVGFVQCGAELFFKKSPVLPGRLLWALTWSMVACHGSVPTLSV